MPAMSDFSCNVKENIKRLETSLNVERNFDILQREVMIAGHRAGFFFIDGFVREDMVEKLMQFFYSLKESDMENLDVFLENGMPYTEVEKSGNVDTVITQFLSGVSVMVVDGFDECLLIDCRTYPMRSVSEPWKDRVLRGSRDGFVETLVSNAALLRRRIRDPKFSMELFGVGRRSRSDVAVCYISDSVDRNTLDRMRKLIQSIDVDALTMNIESLAECMFTHKWINPFPKFKYSERPDTATAAILDGNIVIMVDNSPAVMIIPASIFDIIEEADDFNLGLQDFSFL
jgi:stage V sporulation protein AF